MTGALRPHTRGLAVGAAVATATLGLAVAAVGAGGALKPATASVEIPDEQIAGVVAKCRKGMQVVSNGFSTPSFDETFATGPSIFPIQIQPRSKRALRTRAFNFGQDAGRFRAHAYCSKRKLGLSVASRRSAPVPSEFAGSRSATARCSKGSKAIAGGFRLDFGGGLVSPRLVAHVSRRAGRRGWTVAAANDGGGPGRFEAVAICARRAPDLVARSRTRTLASETSGAVRASCKRGTKPFSGGFRSPVSTGDTEESSLGAFPFTSKRAGRGRWQARFFAIEGAPVRATAIAYCAR